MEQNNATLNTQKKNLLEMGMPLMYQKLTGSGMPSASHSNTAVSPSAPSNGWGLLIQKGAAEGKLHKELI